ncbi:9552_t:CDS:2, partial [Entrophospora sp. SA101]
MVKLLHYNHFNIIPLLSVSTEATNFYLLDYTVEEDLLGYSGFAEESRSNRGIGLGTLSEASTSTLPQIEMADSISQDTDKQKKHLATMNISTRAIEPS